MTILKAVVLSAILLPLGFLASARYAVVDVHEEGPEGIRLKIPVPIDAAQLALRFVPDKITRVRIPEFSEYLHIAEILAAELENMEDAELVRVLDRSEQVTVAKVGNNLVVEATGPGESVRVRFPIATLGAVLGSYDGECFHAARILSAVKSTPGGLVHFRDNSTEVRVAW
jgi:hypothetical protein